MAEISIGEAAGAGLRLIRREPRAVLGWAGLYLAFTVVLWAMMGATFANFFTVLREADGAEPAVADMLALQMQMMALQPLFTLGVFALQTVIMGAIFRAVLEPDQRRFAYMRLSIQELWLFLVYVVLSFGIGIAAAMLLFPVAGIAAFVSFAFRESLGPWGLALVGAPGLLALVGVVVWLTLRLCLAYPMSFADRNFRLFESWAMTRGRTGRLFLAFLLALLITLAIQLVGFLVCAAVTLAVIGPQWQTLMAGDPLVLFRAVGPLLALFAILGSVLSALTATITTAPLADAYRQLTAPADA